MSHLFLSYAREDGPLATRVQRALEERGMDVWIDVEDIPAASRWDDDIRRAILDADAFVFLISPDSLASTVCRRELEYAKENGKRIVPVEARPADPAAAPEALAELHWKLSLAEGHTFDPAIEALCRAIETDLEWVRTHTELQREARTWKDRNRPRSLLARRGRLPEAERALAQGAGRDPAPTPEQTEWVLASRRAATALRNWGLGIAIAIAIGFGVVAGYALKQRGEALDQRNIATMRALVARVQIEQQSGNHERSLLLARQAALFARRQPEVRDAGVDRALRTALAASGGSHVVHVGRYGGSFGAVGFSSDGRTLVAASDDGLVRQWQTDHLERRPRVTGESGGGLSLATAVSPDGRWTARTVDEGIELRALSPGAQPTTLSAPQHPTALAFSQDGRALAAVYPYDDRRVIVWDLRRPDVRPLTWRAPGWLHSVAFSPDGRTLATGGGYRERRTWLWDLRRPQRPPRTLVSPTDSVSAIAFDPGGDVLATADFDGAIRLWNLRTGARDTLADGIATTDLEFSPDGRRLAAGGGDWRVRVWDLVSRDKPPRVLEGYEEGVVSLAFSPDGQAVGAMFGNGHVRFDDLRPASPLPGVTPLGSSAGGEITALDFEPGQASLLLGDRAGDVLRMSVTARELQRRRLAGGDPVTGVALVGGGSLRAITRTQTEGNAKVVELVPTAGGADTRRWQIRPQIAGSLAVSPDSRTVAMAGGGLSDDIVRVADLRDSQLRPVALNGRLEVGEPAMAFSPDSRWLAVPGFDSQLRIWDMRRVKAAPTRLEMPHGDDAEAVAFSDEGRRFAAGGTSGRLRVWRTDAIDESPLDLEDDHRAITALAFDHSGTLLAVGKNSGFVRIWDLSADPPQMSTYQPHRVDVTALAFDDAGRLLASGSEEGTVDVRAPTPMLVELVCSRVRRNLTPDEWIDAVGTELPYERTCPNLPANSDG